MCGSGGDGGDGGPTGDTSQSFGDFADLAAASPSAAAPGPATGDNSQSFGEFSDQAVNSPSAGNPGTGLAGYGQLSDQFGRGIVSFNTGEPVAQIGFLGPDGQMGGWNSPGPTSDAAAAAAAVANAAISDTGEPAPDYGLAPSDAQIADASNPSLGLSPGMGSFAGFSPSLHARDNAAVQAFTGFLGGTNRASAAMQGQSPTMGDYVADFFGDSRAGGFLGSPAAALGVMGIGVANPVAGAVLGAARQAALGNYGSAALSLGGMVPGPIGTVSNALGALNSGYQAAQSFGLLGGGLPSLGDGSTPSGPANGMGQGDSVGGILPTQQRPPAYGILASEAPVSVQQPIPQPIPQGNGGYIWQPNVWAGNQMAIPSILRA